MDAKANEQIGSRILQINIGENVFIREGTICIVSINLSLVSYVNVWEHMFHGVHVWSEDNIVEFILSSSLYMVPMEGTLAIRLFTKCLYLLSHLFGPDKGFLNNNSVRIVLSWI